MYVCIYIYIYIYIIHTIKYYTGWPSSDSYGVKISCRSMPFGNPSRSTLRVLAGNILVEKSAAMKCATNVTHVSHTGVCGKDTPFMAAFALQCCRRTAL